MHSWPKLQSVEKLLVYSCSCLMLLVVVAALFLFRVATPCLEQPPVVTLPTGSIRGHRLQARGGRPFSAYESIPYAAPPVGSLRWQPAPPPLAWPGIRDLSLIHI